MAELLSDDLSIAASRADSGRRSARARGARTFTATSALAKRPICVGPGEVDRELKRSTGGYSRWVAFGRLPQSIADYPVRRLEAVKATLQWGDNEALPTEREEWRHRR
jgi:hypothetical protein